MVGLVRFGVNVDTSTVHDLDCIHLIHTSEGTSLMMMVLHYASCKEGRNSAECLSRFVAGREINRHRSVDREREKEIGLLAGNDCWSEKAKECYLDVSDLL